MAACFVGGREYDKLAADTVHRYSIIGRSSRSQFQAMLQCLELVLYKSCIQDFIVRDDGAKTASNAIFLVCHIESSNWSAD